MHPMRRPFRSTLFLAVGVLGLTFHIVAALAQLPREVATGHSITLAGRQLDYTATAGAITLSNDKGDRNAEVFFVAYTLKGSNPAVRPITFAFNGGPGAASAYLHIGALGPR